MKRLEVGKDIDRKAEWSHKMGTQRYRRRRWQSGGEKEKKMRQEEMGQRSVRS